MCVQYNVWKGKLKRILLLYAGGCLFFVETVKSFLWGFICCCFHTRLTQSPFSLSLFSSIEKNNGCVKLILSLLWSRKRQRTVTTQLKLKWSLIILRLHFTLLVISIGFTIVLSCFTRSYSLGYVYCSVSMPLKSAKSEKNQFDSIQ